MGPPQTEREVTNSMSGEIAGAFMFRPAHRFGWFLEPAYDYTLPEATSNPPV
jgi:hypothetical protein